MTAVRIAVSCATPCSLWGHMAWAKRQQCMLWRTSLATRYVVIQPCNAMQVLLWRPHAIGRSAVVSGYASVDQLCYKVYGQLCNACSFWALIARLSYKACYQLIITITYSFMCYFSKQEHITHYKAKNKTLPEQTSVSTHTHTQLCNACSFYCGQEECCCLCFSSPA